MMAHKLNSISIKSQRDRKEKFTSLIHHINVINLAECYKELKRNKACGVDGVTVEEYGLNLEQNLELLVGKLKNKSWRPLPVRRVYIPKPGKNEKRGLGIPSVEDKLVQIAVKKILEAIFEPIFLDSSFGFRPNRSCHKAIVKLDKEVMTKPVNFLAEVDIRKFFDNVNHYWLLRCIEEKVSDPNMIWIIRQLLQAGVMEDGAYSASTMGTPQGGIVSPLLANIYLHYVLDLWFETKFKRQCRGYASQVRYCDDFVVCFDNREDAELYINELKERLKKFSLEVSEAKTKIIEFGRRAWYRSRKFGGKVATFTFLGFTHYCRASQRGHFVMGHKTSKGSHKNGLQAIQTFIKRARNAVPLSVIWQGIKPRLIGHYNYFAVSGNYCCVKQYYRRVISLVFKWVNRRSQKKSMNWERFMNYLGLFPLPKPRIYHAFYTF
jgi:RNA-directed DNA polymerase